MDIAVVDISLWTRIKQALIRNPIESNGGSNCMYTSILYVLPHVMGFFFPINVVQDVNKLVGQIFQSHDQQNDCQYRQGYYISFWAPGTIHICGIELSAKKTKIITAYIESIALMPKFFLPQEKLVVY